MGVPADLLGKQVRCPNCKQVVLAPVNASPSGVVPVVNLPPSPLTAVFSPPPSAPGPRPPTESEFPLFSQPPREKADSILGDPNESEDEVFASQSQAGRRLTVPPLC